ncbi:Nitrilase family, member 2 [Seminavis robusta]|uniref:Nitrilase family, member 2 n=1 Tax=Seminavis robusta TaxID=568900 RepID=A0A9N8E5Y4_9STRA|nr:Nitrilase family, member 2 [Seminavis robusta]|eukprot:Sro550_g164700.1 Nitrilase family, member 2 (287) ;mRNA; r:30648-31508
MNMMNQTFAPYPYYPNQAFYYPAMPQYPNQQTQMAQPQRTHSTSSVAPITPTENDVLMGRGGKNNLHIGNEKLRAMARAKVSVYANADKKDKSNMSLSLVAEVHALSPAGRFLKRDPATLTWHIVPDELAREKTSQCLRDAVSEGKKRRRNSDSKVQQAKKQQQQTAPMNVPQEPLVRKVTPILLDMSAISNNMSDLTSSPVEQKPQNEDDNATVTSIFTIPAEIIADLLETSPKDNVIHEVSTIVSDDPAEPSYDFELFDSDSLLSEENLLLEPIAVDWTTSDFQ